ncbi:MAG: hypothetical protein ACU0GG_19830 [Paracoccaceae bacterium]
MIKTLQKSFDQFLLKELAVFSALALGALVFSSTAVRATEELAWTAGIGLERCGDLEELDNARVYGWLQGYWTGANLYLGGTDLCLERGVIAPISQSDAIAVLRVHCAPIQNYPIMFAAFNALKGIPKLEGSKAAGCGVEETK